MNKILFALATSMLLGAATPILAQSTTPAFPTAEGFGRFTSGGRGGQVVFVTNTSDYATGEDAIEGSLRWALTQYPGERLTVLFRTSGVINLKEDLKCNREGYTIAGQSAPGDGICLRGAKLNLGGSKNVIIRHIRFRIGLTDDGAFIPGGSIGVENCSDIILDHCDFGWAGEENITMYDNKRTTVQWCLIHEGLSSAGHSKGARSYGTQWGGDFSSYHHNLIAHCHNRSPRFNGARDNRETNDIKVLTDFVNNVVYNWGKQNSCYGGDLSAPIAYTGNETDEEKAEKDRLNALKSSRVNMINNYYKPGPARPASSNSYFVEASYGKGSHPSKAGQFHLSGNIMEGSKGEAMTADNSKGININRYPDSIRSQVLSAEAFDIEEPYAISTGTAAEAFESVLSGVGTFPRDTVGSRIVRETREGTASGKGTSEFEGENTPSRYYQKALGIIDSPEAVGGYPVYRTYNAITDNDNDGMDDAWETENGLDPTDAEDRNTLNTEGYTALEVYLAYLADEKMNQNFSAGISRIPFAQEKLTVFPNPAVNELFVETNRILETARIFAADGRLVKECALNHCGIVNVAELPEGHYILTVIDTEGEANNIRFVKK